MIFKNVKNINIPEGVVVKIATALDGIILWQKQGGTEIPNNEIWYTSTDGNIVTPKTITGNTLISNTYENGVGKLVYKNEITAVVEDMFYEKATLSTITIPESVTTINSYAFFACEKLNSINLPNSLIQIQGYGCFAGCSSLEEITIPDTVTNLTSNSTFAGCSSLTKVVLPNSLTKVTSSMFNGCSNLRNIKIPNSVTEIGSMAFQQCSNLTEIPITESVTKIGSFAFYHTGIEELIIPNTVTSIESNAFGYCLNLTSIVLPNSILNFDKSVFSSNRNLNSIISPSLTAPSIYKDDWEKQGTFNNAGADIPEGEKFIYIHQNADYESYTTGEWKTQLIDKGWKIRFIEGDEPEPENPDTPDEPIEPEEPEIVIPTGNTILYTTTDDSIMELNSAYNPVILSHTYENGLGTLELSTEQNSINDNIFTDTTKLKTIIIGDGFDTIIELAGCTNLEKVIMSDSITTMENRCFQNDINLQEVILSNSITEIPDSCFKSCKKLTTIEIPNSVTTIKGAFSGSGLESIIIPDTVTNLDFAAFWNCENLATVVIGSGITKFDSYSEESGYNFFNCYKLNSITAKAIEAPSILIGDFSGVGSKVEGDKILKIPANATGYEAWLEKLNGFKIEYITE